jgi:virulence-associated protein VapD
LFSSFFLTQCRCSQQDAERTVQAFEDLRREYEKLRSQKMDVEVALQATRQDVQVAHAINSRLQQDVEVLSECVVRCDGLVCALPHAPYPLRSQRRPHSIF